MSRPAGQTGLRPVWLGVGIGCLAGIALAYELCLVRVLAWIHHPRFAAMIISLALLGYALSGTILARVATPRRRWIVACAAGFAGAMPACAGLAAGIPFNGHELIWDWRQLPWLGLMFGLLSLPFLLAATAIGMSLIAFPNRLGRLYGADLAGAGLGAGATMFLIEHFELPAALLTLALLGSLPVACLVRGLRLKARHFAWSLAIPLVAVALQPWVRAALEPSEHKPLSRMLAARGSSVLASRHGLLGVLTLVRNSEVPVRFAPGLSLFSPDLPPAQVALFRDASEMTAIDLAGGRSGYLAAMPSALPYQIGVKDRALVLGLGGGQVLHQALFFGSRSVVVVEPDRRIVQLVLEMSFEDRPEKVRFETRLPRHFVAGTGDEFDVIVIDRALAPAAGSGVGGEDYLMTVEGLGAVWSRLGEGGRMAVTVPLEVPPRSALKLLNTVHDALKTAGMAEPLIHFAMLRSLNTATLVAARAPLSAADQLGIRRFAESHGFDLAWLPDLAPDEPNRNLQWERPWLYEAAWALEQGQEAGSGSYPFAVHPPRDDRPYFDHYFRWSLLPRFWEQRGEGALAMIELGYLLILATVLIAIVCGTLFLILPALPLVRRLRGERIGGWTVYFGAVGLGFMFIEIAVIQKLHLLFGTPVQAVGIALGGFLVFAGVGASFLAQRSRVVHAVVGIALACLLAAWLVEPIGRQVAAWPALPRLVAAIAMMAPAAVCMGVPFPAGLRRVVTVDARLAGWAWGVNGCASVVAAPGAVLLAHHLGFRGVLGLAALLYLGAGWVYSRRQTA